jgi:Zn finger protein HypA/HybF involved in hydrogenase expression
VGAIIRLIILSKEKNINLSFINVNDKIKSVINVLGLAHYVQIDDNPDNKKFPMVIQCPGCHKKVKVKKPGTYNCPHCKESFSFHEYNATM